jgi:uroporphyrinogen III methyltransferase/synthase
MGVTHLGAICRTLLKEGKAGETPATVIESGTLPWQRVIEASLATIAEETQRQKVHPPALLVVGSVTERRSVMGWYESRPLHGQRIIVTRPHGEAQASAAALESLGAEVLLAPIVEILPVPDTGPLDAAIGRLASYDWLVFTSANGVRFFLDRLMTLGGDLRSLGHLRLATIGSGTAQALARYHLRADLVPESYRSEGLVEALSSRVSGARVLLARADRGRQLLKVELDKLADVDQIAVYQNKDAGSLPEPVVERIAEASIDWITLTSSAIAARLHALLPEPARKKVAQEIGIASLSPVTSETIRRLGWMPKVEASTYTWEGLVQALVSQVMARRPTD